MDENGNEIDRDTAPIGGTLKLQFVKANKGQQGKVAGFQGTEN